MKQDACPLVSVVLCAYQAERTLAAAIGSIVDQTYANWELFVLDDGSKDRSVEIARSFRDERITVVADGRNLGLAARLNQGIAHARGEFIARMDADDLCFPDRFERQVAYLRERGDIDLVASSALLFGANMEAIGVLPVGVNHSDICARPWHGFAMPHPTWMGRIQWFRRNRYDERARKSQDQKLLYATYQRSCFSGLPQPLLAYRYERLSLVKTIRGRLHFLRGVASGGSLLHLSLAVLTHSIAAVRDLIAMLVSEDARVIRARVHPAAPELDARWRDLRIRADRAQQIAMQTIGR